MRNSRGLNGTKRRMKEPRFVRAHFDGGRREGVAGAGWVVEASKDSDTWELVVQGRHYRARHLLFLVGQMLA